MTIKTLIDSTFTLSGAWVPKSKASGFFPIADERPDAHQAEMERLLRDTDTDVAINANPTGSGKTLSWVGPTIRSQEDGEPWMVVATYPTIALVSDQHRKIMDHYTRYFSSDEWSTDSPFDLVERDQERVLTDGNVEYRLDEVVIEITSRVTAGQSTGQYIKDAEDTAQQARHHGLPVVFLTTPDTLTLMATGQFHDSDVNSLPQTCNHIVIDEFHLSNPRGKRLLPLHLDIIQQFVGSMIDTLAFLSATPAPTYMDRLDAALNATTVCRDVSSDESDQARQVLPETTLHVSSREMFSTGDWLADHVNAIEDFYSPDGQTLIVVDAVWEVDAVYEVLVAETNMNVGRVYGWKREGRQETIDTADIVVGNTAVEVGIDFERVNRVIFTGYDGASTLQRLGRMRHRSALDDYRAVLLTRSNVLATLQEAASESVLSRETFEKVVNRELTDPVDPPYYDLLCAAYARYLWAGGGDSDYYDGSLRASYPSGGELYRRIVHNHFAEAAAEWKNDPEPPGVEEFWEILETIQNRYRDDGGYPIFEEMHTYRSSSLSCVVLDLDDQDEPLKQYSLRHVLQYRQAEIVPTEELKRRYDTEFGGLSESIEAKIDDLRRSSCGCIVVRGRRKDPRYFDIVDWARTDTMKIDWNRNPKSCIPRPLWDPTIKTNPLVAGLEHIDLLDNEDEGVERDIIAQYIGHSIDRARTEYSLGPYANIASIGRTECLAFWQDGIIAHSHVMSE